MCDDECVKVNSSYTDVKGTYARLGGGYAGLKSIMMIKMPAIENDPAQFYRR